MRWLTSALVLVIVAGATPAPAARPVAGASGTAPGQPPAAAVTEGSALALARAGGRRVEVLGGRTETEQLFANPDGTFTVDIDRVPQRVRRGTGWVPVDATLIRRPDGRIEPRASTVDTVFSGGGDAPLVELARAGRSVALSWPGRLPTPVLAGDTATYADVLPGVDLRMTADVGGFSQVLVVKTAAAARHPALRELRFGVRTAGAELRAGSDGTLALREATGATVFGTGTPTMWDSPASSDRARPGMEARQAPMAVRVEPGALVVVPDAAMLTDPAARFPLHIDPAFTSAQNAWTSVWRKYPTTSYWNRSSINPEDGSKGVVRAGYESDEGNLVRSFFRMPTSAIAGRHILSAVFRMFELHSWSCQARPVELWHSSGISSATTWNTQPPLYERIAVLNTAKGYSSSCPAGGIEFNATRAAQIAAGDSAPSITLGVKAQNESDTFAWKRFRNNQTMSVTYNSYPTRPTKLSTDPSTPCFSGADTDLPFMSTPTPTLKAIVADPDAAQGQQVRARFEWWAKGGAKIGEHVTALAASGSTFSGTVPAGALADGGRYMWRVRAEDGTDVSTFSPWCEFVIDGTPPDKVPLITSDGTYPPGGFAGGIGVPGVFTLSANGVPDVAEYEYWVHPYGAPARVRPTTIGGSATIVVTPTADGPQTLFARSLDQAGNRTSVTPWIGYDFFVAGGGTVPRRPPGDMSGDGRADPTFLYDLGGGRSAVWTLTSKPGGGFHPASVSADTGPGAVNLAAARTATGDFDGDGLTDLLTLHIDAGNQMRINVNRSTGSGFAGADEAYVGSPGNWALASIKLVAGDADGDGRSDVAIFYGYSGARTRGFLALSQSTADDAALGAMTLFYDSGAGGFDWNKATFLTGDYTGDGRDDILGLYDLGTTFRAWVWVAGTDAEGEPVLMPAVWYNAVANWGNFASAKWLAGDWDADGDDDLIMVYGYTGAATSVFTQTSTGSSFTERVERWDNRDATSGVNEFDGTRYKVTIGDWDGDGDADVGCWYSQPGGVVQFFQIPSTRTAYGPASGPWRSPAGVVAWASLTAV
ncbi:FG-GAP-like repeat-containing protein [Virgisporangium aurantiacum]|uniref:Repeat domain-containing protein n=1 Tax=Virgisporangium aurantiacum TaxID=175570 RepID=A0A8J3ZJF4_9ACTN|nr:FG-GAP-like repeat-containing protein [Virgisporangium aurantiacum]GIJ64057.1 hypothetical protein Vau01_115730 [Virgisporangium aurantiacum]